MSLNVSFKYERKDREALKAGGTQLVGLIEKALDGNDYDTGIAEAAERGTQNCAEFLGRLSLLLVEKGIITADELGKVLDPAILGYVDGEWKWPEHTNEPIR